MVRMLALSSTRFFSTSFSLASTWSSESLIGATSDPSSCWRRVRSMAASLWTLPIFWSASLMNSSVLDLRVAAASAANDSRN